MFSMSPEEKARLVQEVASFNADKPPADQIKFLHGSGSASLAFMGKEVTVTHPKHPTRVEKIPYALVPTGILRKQYGVYPISGELDFGAFGSGHRSESTNNHSISGMLADPHGIEGTAMYASASKQFNADKMHDKVNELIAKITEGSYVKTLKILTMELTVMMQMGTLTKENANQYMQMLNRELKILQLNNPGNEQIPKTFNKYLARFDEILKGNMLPFKADEKFKSEIYNQFPVVFCSTAASLPPLLKSHLKEQLFRVEEKNGGLPLDTVKLMFTPHAHVATLKNKLKEMGMNHIEVRGYAIEKKVELQAESEATLSNVKNVAELKQVPNLFSMDSEKVSEKIESCVANYIKSGDPEQLNMAKWMIKNWPDGYIENANHFANNNYQLGLLEPKLAADPHYLDPPSSISETEFARMMVVKQYEALSSLRESSNPTQDLFNYAVSIDQAKLEEAISSRDPKESLQKLVAMYDEFKIDLRTNENQDEIKSRMSLVEAQFLKVLDEGIGPGEDKQNVDNEYLNIFASELFKSVLPVISQNNLFSHQPAIQERVTIERSAIKENPIVKEFAECSAKFWAENAASKLPDYSYILSQKLTRGELSDNDKDYAKCRLQIESLARGKDGKNGDKGAIKALEDDKQLNQKRTEGRPVTRGERVRESSSSHTFNIPKPKEILEEVKDAANRIKEAVVETFSSRGPKR